MIKHVDASSRPVRRVMVELSVVLLLAGLTVADYLAWLGWDQHADVRPDGSQTGPYEAWQVAGLVLVLAAVGIGAVWLGHGVATVLAITGGLTAAVAVDWSDDDSGLWAVGAGLVFVGTLAVTAVVAGVVGSIRNSTRRS